MNAPPKLIKWIKSPSLTAAETMVEYINMLNENVYATFTEAVGAEFGEYAAKVEVVPCSLEGGRAPNLQQIVDAAQNFAIQECLQGASAVP